MGKKSDDKNYTEIRSVGNENFNKSGTGTDGPPREEKQHDTTRLTDAERYGTRFGNHGK